MIRKAKVQYDSGGTILDYSFLLTFDDANKLVDEESVDKYIEAAAQDFKFYAKMKFMFKLGYEGIIDDKWYKTEDICFKCWKCGAITDYKGFNSMCVSPMAVRTSGICGGTLNVAITKETYDKQIKEWEDLRNEEND